MIPSYRHVQRFVNDLKHSRMVCRLVVANGLIINEFNTFSAAVFAGSDTYHLIDNQ